MRLVVEFTLQVVGWAFLGIGGGSLFLLVTQGSAPAVNSVPLALMMTAGAAALIWVTRRSMYKKEYRGY